jgi:hypothetical protein
MTEYWAVLLDETGCEFGAGVTAGSRQAAYDELRDMYPESRIVQVESPQDRADRERRMRESVAREYSFGPDYDYEGF